MPKAHHSGLSCVADFGFPVRPQELKIEITAACNLRCSFCYLGDEDWQAAPHLPEDEVFRWIDWAVDNQIPAVRFTGGEPTLHPRLKVFCGYARLQQRYVILNTNGMGAERLYQELFPVVADLRVSLPTLDSRRLDAISGGQGVLKQKLAVIQQALSAGLQRVSLLTTLLPEDKGKLEAFVKLVQTSAKLHWLPLRYEPTPQLPRPWTRGDAQDFAEEMAALMDRYPEHARGIFLAVPFCAVRPTGLGARVFAGRVRNCGPYVALNVNARGQLQACFGVCELPGPPGTLAEVKNRPELWAVCSRSALPEECQRCPYVGHCAGGCRKPAGLVEHRGRYVDYLAGFLEEKSPGSVPPFGRGANPVA